MLTADAFMPTIGTTVARVIAGELPQDLREVIHYISRLRVY
jgi:hypothetical protein